MTEREMTLVNPQGMHARPASILVELTNRNPCEIHIRKGNREVNAKSILGVLTLGAACGETLTFRAEGVDPVVEAAALDDLAALLASGFGERGA